MGIKPEEDHVPRVQGEARELPRVQSEGGMMAARPLGNDKPGDGKRHYLASTGGLFVACGKSADQVTWTTNRNGRGQYRITCEKCRRASS